MHSRGCWTTIVPAGLHSQQTLAPTRKGIFTVSRALVCNTFAHYRRHFQIKRVFKPIKWRKNAKRQTGQLIPEPPPVCPEEAVIGKS
jgi:hypothetical protein